MGTERFAMNETDRQQMIHDIEAAFADTIYPGDVNISNQGHCFECAEIAEAFRGKNWQELHDVRFLRYYDAALSLFKPPAFRYFLPAYMRAVLIDAEVADVIWDGMFFHLTPPDTYNPEMQTAASPVTDSDVEYFLTRVSGFTLPQKRVIKSYLELLAKDSFTLPDWERRNQRAFAFWGTYER
jgi:hypothetical protein